jgi:sugar lactone lactonase YvrE
MMTPQHSSLFLRSTGQRLISVFLPLLFLFSANLAFGTPPQTAVTLDSAINTVAGTGTAGYDAQQDGGPATSAKLSQPRGVAIDAGDNLYIAEYVNNRVRKVDSQGIITTIAGGGSGCDEQTDSVGDGCLAMQASLSGPNAVAADGEGNLYIADQGNGRVRRVDATTQIITTVAGTGSASTTGDGGAATEAGVPDPSALAFDAQGNLYIAQWIDARIRRVDTEGIITTVAGTGTYGSSGDGGPATEAQISSPAGMVFDAAGNLYVADLDSNRIRKIDTEGIITTIAGTGNYGYSGDGGPATSANISVPFFLAFDAAGNLYVSTYGENRVRKIDTNTQIITTVAGTGDSYGGDGGPATLAGIPGPSGLAFDSVGNLYIASLQDNRIRKVAFATTILPATSVGESSTSQNVVLRINQDLALTAIALAPGYEDFSLGEVTGCTVDGETVNTSGATCSAPVTFTPSAPGTRTAPLLVTDSNGRTYSFGLTGVGVGPVFTFLPGVLSTLASDLGGTQGVATDGAGHVYVSDTVHHLVWRMKSDGSSATVVAGDPELGGTYQGDGGPATSAGLNSPAGLTVDAAGNLYIADRDNNVVRKVDATGVISTVAGNGTAGSSPCDEGGPATDAQLNQPQDVATDNSGNLYIADAGNQAIRKVSSSGVFTTFAGQLFSEGGYAGDGEAATSATLNAPSSVAVDADGNVYIGDTLNYVVREVDHSTGIITTVAGTPGTEGSAGDGEAATSATLGAVNGVAVDGEGGIYIADSNQVIRKVDSEGTIFTVAGNAALGAGSAEGLATAGQLNDPMAVDVDGFGNLYIADKSNGELRKVDAGKTAVTFADTNVGETSASQAVTIRNAGSADLFLPSGSIDNSVFQPAGGTCDGEVAIAAGDSCSLDLAFAPTAGGAATGEATITSNAANSPHLVLLGGTGVAVAASTSTALAASPSAEAHTGDTVTLTATVSASSGMPGGTVTFYDGETVLGSSSLSGGTAVLETGTLAEGQHSLTAQYAGNDSFLASTSSAVELTVVAPPQQNTPDYTLTASPSSLTIVRGQSAQATITLTPLHGFSGTVNLSCGALPIGVTCTFTPPSLVSTGEGAVTSTLEVRTTGTQLAIVHAGSGPAGWTLGLMGVLGMVVMGTGRKRRRKGIAGIFLLALFMTLAGCGDHSTQPTSNIIPTPAGQSTVTVTATGTGGSSSAPQHSVQLTINVTN